MADSSKVVKSAVKPPNAGKGRKKGSQNKTTALLKEAIIYGAETIGDQVTQKKGLEQYCAFLARDEPKAFSQLLGKVLPLQVAGTDKDGNITGLEVTFVRSDSKD